MARGWVPLGMPPTVTERVLWGVPPAAMRRVLWAMPSVAKRGMLPTAGEKVWQGGCLQQWGKYCRECYP